MIYLRDPDVTLYHGDALEILRGLPAESMHCCVTSPPFYGLRDYGTGRWEGGDAECDHETVSARNGRGGSGSPGKNTEGAFPSEYPASACGKCGATRVDQQIGLEETPELWVQSLVEVFREVKRVLRADGTLWLEVGDSYAGSWGAQSRENGTGQNSLSAGQIASHPKRTQTGTIRSRGLKPKDLIGAPWKLAEALKAPYYTGTIKEERDRIWLAAMVDTEGCISIHRRPAGTKAYSKFRKQDGTDVEYERKQDSFQPKVEISNTSLALIERIAALTGEGNTKTKQLAGTFGCKQTLYRWTLTADKARAFLREVYPYLVDKQQEARLGFGCPSSGEKATAAWEALKAIHQGESSEVDFPAPPTFYESGWYLRSDIIFSRPNPMPESVTDRPTKAHSYVFLLTKSPRYFFDQEVVREKYERGLDSDGFRRENGIGAGAKEYVGQSGAHPNSGRGPDGRKKTTVKGQDGSLQHRDGERWPNSGRNIRSVWTIPTQPYPEAHFATFPEELARRCIVAGTSERGCCPECGAPWVREVEQTPISKPIYSAARGYTIGSGARDTVTRFGDGVTTQTIGWRPSCYCVKPDDWIAKDVVPPLPHPCIVLDPFVGSGTVPYVARKLGQHAIGIDLSAEYLKLAAKRLQQQSLFVEMPA